jgi:hypothetical protein
MNLRELSAKPEQKGKKDDAQVSRIATNRRRDADFSHLHVD